MSDELKEQIVYNDFFTTYMMGHQSKLNNIIRQNSPCEYVEDVPISVKKEIYLLGKNLQRIAILYGYDPKKDT